MPTLSFSCPRCTKMHERVKPEMVGHKVRCQCGFVFRLGSKSDKQEWFSAELKRKKELKKQQELEATQLASDNGPGLFELEPGDESFHGSESSELFPSHEINEAIASLAEQSSTGNSVPNGPLNDDWDDEILDAIPVAESPGEVLNVGAIPDQLLEAISVGTESPEESGPSHFLSPGDPVNSSPNPGAFPGAGYSQPGNRMAANREPISGRRLKNRKRAVALGSPAGSVWTLVLTLFGAPALTVVMLLFAGSAVAAYQLSSGAGIAVPGRFGQGGGMKVPESSGLSTAFMMLQMVFSVGMFLLFGALLMSMVAAGVAAIIELAKGTYIGWAQKLTAATASLTLGFLFLFFCFNEFMLFYTVREFQSASQATVDNVEVRSAAFWMAFRYALFGLVPLLAAITSFTRIFSR